MIDEASIRRDVNPSHYTELKPEPIDVIEDIRKARWYLDREIARLELEPTPSDTPS